MKDLVLLLNDSVFINLYMGFLFVVFFACIACVAIIIYRDRYRVFRDKNYISYLFSNRKTEVRIMIGLLSLAYILFILGFILSSVALS